MLQNLTWFGLCSIFLHYISSQLALAANPLTNEDRNRILTEYAEFEKETEKTLANAFQALREDTCEAGHPGCDGEVPSLPAESKDVMESFDLLLGLLLARIENVRRILVELIPAVVALASSKVPAIITEAIVSPEISTQAVLTCKSTKNLTMSFCLWKQGLHGKLIYIDDTALNNNGAEAATNGNPYIDSNGLAARKCELKIQSVGANDIGRWSCTVVSQSGDMFTGEVILVVNATAALAQSSAHVSRHKVVVKLNDSQALPCGSNGQRLNACFWERPASRDPRVIFVDQKEAENGGNTNGNGISCVTAGELINGNCAIGVHRITKYDVGNWSCTLVLQNGGIVTEVTDVRLDPTQIYFATWEGGIQAYSVATSQVSTVVDSTEGFFGIVHDSIRKLIYWSSRDKIYRANENGSMSELVFNAAKYSFCYAVDFDWITNSLYIATGGGHILACNAGHRKTLRCSEVLTGQGIIEGISLNPPDGYMYWTKSGASDGAVVRAEMDGSRKSTLFSRLKHPRGITIDFESSSLYWACAGDDTIQRSNLEGRNGQTVLRLPKNTWPQGITIFGNKICWGANFLRKLQCSPKNQDEISTLYTGRHDIKHMTIVPGHNLHKNRTNHCAAKGCSGDCVLTAQSSRCLS